ncbi:MAG: hypothetical protein COS76_01095 [Candidatus Portnoybacteria bacterium CG06_land_8_20_14_3_00_39_12]|uniref:YkuD domain-containing protein n=3 Tax=Candidatus Portnoyibacteriota TaxID=1817913 RepID=A0A2M8KFM6_9BACT|nr:MAG: hypothetical protein AUJ33_02480 [Parcubacteria group bacterium CG1_02_40_25]PIU75385.1 MAG: hypothetical protein COS76_01095 [Candidatus Portnoybacteria bacterium CG06_land_8_20_14_3_00_39_12]PIZ71687.1 MAG: hypothetical protein COY09_00260 [Candidatus Portnoybacteria bacterium CG_4_10_14_0_2_um_filter_39_11]PJE58721.1 MAG: hypothetical protein COU83_02290 [Candidatus Portnoybacteria bacterium CG10_big_fil_rev_8_21_14_0_10_40_22]
MKQKLTSSLLFLMILSFIFVETTGVSESKSGVKDLQIVFQKNVGSKLLISKESSYSFIKEDIVQELYLKKILKDALVKILSLKDANQSQCLVYVDRNPEKQVIVAGFFDVRRQSITIIGIDKVSTGNQKRRGYFITPVGIFEHSRDYQALGTKNDKGWRGLGAKGSRVWDFGWRTTFNKKGEEVDIRLLMHATDPDFGESRLGRVASKGCVRISGKLNRFLDKYKILDGRGKYLMVGDSRLFNKS